MVHTYNNLLIFSLHQGCRVVEARGHYVIPGGIDPHTHFQTQFMGATTADDFYTGSRAAIAGGTTTILNHVILPGSGLIDAFDRFRSLAEDRICCDFGLHIAITNYVDGRTEQEMETLVKDRGVNSFKVFMAYKNSLQLSDGQLIKVFDICKKLGAIPLVHAENGDVIDHLSSKLLKLGVTGPEGHLQARPEEIEGEATHRAITLANAVGCPVYIVHVMSKSAAEEISRARNNGLVVFGETITAALGSDGTNCFSRCWKHAAGHIMSPPLRPDRTTPEALMGYLSSGQLSVTGSDHCTFNAVAKALGEKNFTKIPNGVNGVEERMAIVWEKGVKTGKLTLPQFVAATSANAAKIFNIYPRKGRIAIGSDADVVVWGRRPTTISKNSHHSAVDFNIFEGTNTEFNPIVVIAGGRIVLDEEGKLHTIQGSGRYVPGTPFSHIAFSRLIQRDLNLGPIKVDRSATVAPIEVASKEQTGKSVVDPPPAKGGDGENRNGAKPSTPLSLSTELDAFRLSEQGPHSPSGSSTGSNTPTKFHKTATRSGVRSQQDSSFALTGEQVDDDKKGRTAIKLHQPPGGKSSGLW